MEAPVAAGVPGAWGQKFLMGGAVVVLLREAGQRLGLAMPACQGYLRGYQVDHSPLRLSSDFYPNVF